MATKQQDEYLKTAFGVDPAQHRSAAPAVTKPAAPTKEETPAPKRAAPPAKPPPEDLDEPPAHPPGAWRDIPESDPDAPKPKLPSGAAMIDPGDLVKLRAGLASIAREIKDGIARQKEIVAEANKAHVDPEQTDGVAQAGARLNAIMTEDEHDKFNIALAQVKKSKEDIVELLDRTDETKKHLANFRALKLEGVSDADKEEKGKRVANAFDYVVNLAKGVIDIVTGDLGRFGALILVQANLETLDSDAVKDSIEATVNGIKEEQNEIVQGLNKMVSQLNEFRAAEIKTLVETLHDLGKNLVARFGLLETDLKNMGEVIQHIGNAHKGDADNFAPLMSVYRKIAEADVLLSKVDALAQRSTLADKRWPGVLVPLGTPDQYPLSLGAGAEALVYRSGGTTHYFIIKTSSATFATGDGAPKAIEKLAEDYKTLQAARAAYAQVRPLAEQWSKALSAGMDSPKH